MRHLLFHLWCLLGAPLNLLFLSVWQRIPLGARVLKGVPGGYRNGRSKIFRRYSSVLIASDQSTPSCPCFLKEDYCGMKRVRAREQMGFDLAELAQMSVANV